MIGFRNKPAKHNMCSKMDPMNRFLRYMPQLFYTGVALLSVFSLIPAASVPQAFHFWDKAQHALAYVALAVTGCLAFPRRVMPVFVGLLGHGAVIEILQGSLTTTRFGEVSDWLADAIGVLVGVAFYRRGLAKPEAMPRHRG